MSTQPSVFPFPLIRTARPDDVERIAWLEQIGFPDPWPRELLAYELTHPLSLVLAAVWGEGLPVVGYASFRKGGGEAELLRLAVAPGERRRGIARALVLGGMERLRTDAIETCFLEVRTNNAGAIAFYREMGFEPVGRRRAYYRDGADALVYARRVALQ